MTLASLKKEVPSYLRTYIAEQNPKLYTPIDHAGWRFILKISRAHFARYAHQIYLDGLEKTGISLEHIPLIEEMDQKLQRFGWRAVPVCGFIPPLVFMEFLSRGILPIACDMRTIEHLSYTPAPDIVHESAGHAPIIADPDYARYLREYGEISRKAIHSKEDWNLYLAIRDLSDIKEDPRTTPEQIKGSQAKLDAAVARIEYVSEAAQLSRMLWWTAEYGLIGDLEKPKIYGAGLLSSLSEGYDCLGEKVKKIPFSISCVETGYDITRPQPQLFVARDFGQLITVLRELAETMAFRIGGLEGLTRAKKAGTVTTAVLDSGLQISGVIENFAAKDKTVSAIRFSGPMQLARNDQEIEFRPMGGEFPLPPGAAVVSVFGGAADRDRYSTRTATELTPLGKPKTNLTPANRQLNELYARVRELRAQKTSKSIIETTLSEIHRELEKDHPEDWLLRYELLELCYANGLDVPWRQTVFMQLERASGTHSPKAGMIRRGLELLS